ncbi:MAG: dihydrofolate reductase [Succinivibrio sp.]
MTDVQIIVAIASNYVIGKDGQIPWHLSEDLKHFKEITSGHSVIMGRRTFESIGKILPNRTNIMVSSTFDKDVEGLSVVGSLQEAIDSVKSGPAFIIGGARMYKEALPLASTLHLTVIDREFEGDTRFPDFHKEPFVMEGSVSFHSDKCGFDYSFQTWKRH